MDWIGNQLSIDPGFGTYRPETSFSFLYNYDHHRYPAGLDQLKHPHETHEHGVGMAQNLDKKKRLTSEQLDSLEMSFQEEIKLDPDRKMVLAQELGLQPRQVAVWFQNRRARWKAKQLERLYDSLKKELDRVSMEKNQLQQEVMALRAMILNEDAVKKQTKCTLTCNSAGYTDVSCGEDTLESTSLVAVQSCNYMPRGTSIATTSNISQQNQHQVVDHGDNEGNYDVYMDDYYPVEITPNWGGVMP